MRKYLFALMITASVMSCRSIDKMIEKGQYDQAFEYGIDKLRGTKDKKDEHVKGIETAFRRLNTMDLMAIDRIKSQPHEHMWGEINRLYNKIDRRQTLIAPLLPLRSEKGRVAKIEIVNYLSNIAEARQKDANYKYDLAINLLKRSRSGDHLIAREAYAMFETVKAYDPQYDRINELMDEAFDLGLLTIGVDYRSNTPSYSNDLIFNRLTTVNLQKYNTFWERYTFVTDRNADDFDRYIVVNVEDINLGIEREVVNNFEFSELISDGTKYLYDNNGNVLKDSLNNKLTEPNMVKVKAFVSQIRREKSSSLTGVVRVFDKSRTYPIATQPIQVNFNFRDEAANYTGDKRAINGDMRKLLNNRISNFPDNISMILSLSSGLAIEVDSKINNLRRNIAI